MRVQLSSLLAAATVVLALNAAPAFAQAKTSVCKDGTTSTTAGRGACSGHGGVDAAKTSAAAKPAPKSAAKPTPAAPVATAAPMKAAPAAKKDAPASKKDVAANTKAKNDDKDATGATAQCKDGSYSHAASHRGACSNHGGVAKFLK